MLKSLLCSLKWVSARICEGLWSRLIFFWDYLCDDALTINKYYTWKAVFDAFMPFFCFYKAGIAASQTRLMLTWLKENIINKVF